MAGYKHSRKITPEEGIDIVSTLSQYAQSNGVTGMPGLCYLAVDVRYKVDHSNAYDVNAERMLFTYDGKRWRFEPCNDTADWITGIDLGKGKLTPEVGAPYKFVFVSAVPIRPRSGKRKNGRNTDPTNIPPGEGQACKRRYWAAKRHASRDNEE